MSRCKAEPAVLCGLLLVALLTACGESDNGNEQRADGVNSGDRGDSGGRWYSPAQVAAGAEIFASNCALCHGPNAEGTVADWRQRLDDGSFPPPPLNGSAHAWHHPLSILLQVIDNGGSEYGGQMPGFADLLSDDEKLAAIAYFQDFWSDEIYGQWEQMGGTN